MTTRERLRMRLEMAQLAEHERICDIPHRCNTCRISEIRVNHQVRDWYPIEGVKPPLEADLFLSPSPQSGGPGLLVLTGRSVAIHTSARLDLQSLIDVSLDHAELG